METQQNWAELARLVRERRERMQLRQSDIPGRGGPSLGTVQNIEQGSRSTYAARSLRQLELALAWSYNTVDRILDGTATPELLDEVWVANRSRWVRLNREVGLPDWETAVPLADPDRDPSWRRYPTQYVRPEGIPSAEAVGIPTVVQHSAVTESAPAVDSVEADLFRGGALVSMRYAVEAALAVAPGTAPTPRMAEILNTLVYARQLLSEEMHGRPREQEAASDRDRARATLMEHLRAQDD